MIKPSRLKKGDIIGVISPSWGGPSSYPHIYEEGLNTLKKLGFKIKEFKSTKADADFIYNNPKVRADDIMNAFKDNETKAIICSIGGDDSIRVLEYLDKNIIISNPKIVMGFSDNAILNTYFNQLGLVTFNAPSIMAGFAQYSIFGKDFQKHIDQFLFYGKINFFKNEKYLDGYYDWNDERSIEKSKNLFIDEKIGWQFLQGEGVFEGRLFGGCIEVLEFMKGTKYWPEKDFWKDKILFFETSEEHPKPEFVKWWLRNYGIQGIFDKINGIIFGRCARYSDLEKKEFNENILKVVRGEFNNSKIPIITNFDIGHTDPQNIMPLGIKIRIDSDKKSITVVEDIFTN